MVDICYNCVVNIETSWKDYITKKYLEWRADKLGRKGSAAAFAREINISPQLLSDWMNKGQIVSDQENINKLVEFLGYEVYDVLGLRRPDAGDPRSTLLSVGFPSEFVEAVLAARAEFSAELFKRGITQDSPEAREIIKQAFARHGVQLTDTEPTTFPPQP